MNIKKLILFGGIVAAFACTKTTIETPINENANEHNIGCATCPASFYNFDDVPASEEITICDDFTDIELWPEADILSEEILGYTQEETHPVTASLGTGGSINGGGSFPGLYPFGIIEFLFDGSQQDARFNLYGLPSQYGEMGFAINGSALHFMDESFPMTIGGVTITIDDSAPDIGFWTNIYFTFSGEIEAIEILGFESGITELCVTKKVESTPPIIDKTTAVYFDDFFNYDGSILGAYPNYKTPMGYYGEQGFNFAINFDDFLAYKPTKIGFVHAYFDGNSNLINVQLPDVPLIITIPDSLAYYLSPYGYNVEIHHQTDGHLWTNTISEPLEGAIIDSILIKGNKLEQVKLGANLQSSELRSICSYYE